MHICADCGEFIYPGQTYHRNRKGKVHLKPTCMQAGSASVQAPIFWEDGIIFHSKTTPRLLETRVAISRKIRHCWYCEQYDTSFITEGEEYAREVWLFSVGVYWEHKRVVQVCDRHHPECPLPFDEYEPGASLTLIRSKKNSVKNVPAFEKAA